MGPPNAAPLDGGIPQRLGGAPPVEVDEVVTHGAVEGAAAPGGAPFPEDRTHLARALARPRGVDWTATRRSGP